uniref:Uncharacterized protein n=1 Tax=Anopheles farauti TaxID=69004 RepID=A0A182QYW2_9DIPT
MNPTNPAVAIVWPLVFALLVPGSASQELYGRSRAVASSCPEAEALRDVNPRQCCPTFLPLHTAIIDCLSKPGIGAGPASCIAQCLLQNFRAQKIVVSTTFSMSSLIAVGPKLMSQFERCHSDLFEFVVGNTFDGDFRRIVCDERLNKFFECMVKGWFNDCIDFDESNAKCVELQNTVKTSNCTLGAFFTQAVSK